MHDLTTGPVQVAAAVIEREGRFLVARRPPHKHHGGLWEFPGGKLRTGESVPEAIGRELLEELDLELERTGPLLFRVRDPATSFEILFVEVSALGAPRALEHTEFAWLSRARLHRLRLAPADRQFVLEGLTRSNPDT
jgi:8-oxo-dGTP diphosphatase